MHFKYPAAAPVSPTQSDRHCTRRIALKSSNGFSHSIHRFSIKPEKNRDEKRKQNFLHCITVRLLPRNNNRHCRLPAARMMKQKCKYREQHRGEYTIHCTRLVSAIVFPLLRRLHTVNSAKSLVSFILIFMHFFGTNTASSSSWN